MATGEKGSISRTYEVVKENGKVVAKNLQAEAVLKEPKNKSLQLAQKQSLQVQQLCHVVQQSQLVVKNSM